MEADRCSASSGFGTSTRLTAPLHVRHCMLIAFLLLVPLACSNATNLMRTMLLVILSGEGLPGPPGRQVARLPGTLVIHYLKAAR